MLANDGSASHVEGDAAASAPSNQRQRGADDIDNGVDRADLVKVNLPREWMYRRFGFAQKLKAWMARPHSFREGAA